MSVKKIKIVLVGSLLFISSLACNGVRADGPKEWLKNNNKTQVMVLASEHLSRYKERLTTQDMQPLLEKLQQFQPDVIGVEHLAPQRISNYTNREIYQSTLEQFSPDIKQLSASARAVLKKNESAALDAVLLSSQLDNINSSEQKILAYLAGYDLYSAVLHWSYLSDKQRTQSALSEEIKNRLSNTLNAVNENALIGIQLAKRLGLERVTGIDDHSDKDVYMHNLDELFKAFKSGNVQLDRDYIKQVKDTTSAFVDKKNLIGLYRYLNTPEFGKKDQFQWQAILNIDTPDNSQAARMAMWELRNMNIAANIVRLASLHPKGKILVIIGASHKAYLDDYLGRLSTIEIVQPVSYLTEQ